MIDTDASHATLTTVRDAAVKRLTELAGESDTTEHVTELIDMLVRGMPLTKEDAGTYALYLKHDLEHVVKIVQAILPTLEQIEHSS